MGRLFLLLTVGGDIRLLNQWLTYYMCFDFDDILISVHAPSTNCEILHQVKARCDIYRVKIAEVHEEPGMDIQGRRNRMMSKFCSKDDWVIMADLDEFHEFSMPPRDMVSLCERSGYDYVGGSFLDRIGPQGDFPELSAEPVWDQYPVGTLLTQNVLGATHTKVVVARAFLHVPFGQHTAAGRACPDREAGVIVHHFKWDASVLDRCRFMTWQYSMAEEPWFMEPLKFLKYAGEQQQVDLEDPDLGAYWPRYERRRPSDAVTQVSTVARFDPVDFRPKRSDRFQISGHSDDTVLADTQNGGNVRIGGAGAMIWHLCDGSHTVAEIADVLAPDVMAPGLGAGADARINVERNLQMFIRQLLRVECVH